MIPHDDSEFDFDELLDQEFDFYGVDNDCFKLDDQIYEAIEDEENGYRSYLETVEVREDTAGLIFFTMPVARVVLDCDDGMYRLVDLHDEHVWLRFGTDYTTDAMYPCFRFEYTPKGPRD